MTTYKPRPKARGSRIARAQSNAQLFADRMKAGGVLTDNRQMREQVRAEARQCPHCDRPVHPDNWLAHVNLYHPSLEAALPESHLALSRIRVDGGTQTRAAINHDTVRDYAESLESGASFPPLEVYYDGSDYWLADGFHRLEAAKICQYISFQANVHQGTRRDAILYSVGANSAHGLRRTNDDKRRAVLTLLRDEEWVRWSDREIARRAGVSNRFVTTVRAEIGVSVNGSQIERTAERNGTTYTMSINPETRGAKPAERLADTAPELVERVLNFDISLPEAKALAKEAPEIRREVIDRVKSGEFPSAHRALDEVRKPHVAHNSGENEWYTPAEYIEAARRVLGGIDLDPASSDIANHTVQASRYFDAATNGLLQEWHGRVWMNPPYSKDLIEGFCRQLVTEYSAGRTTQAIVLVNNATETRWFQLLLQHAAAVCFPASRIRFVDPQGNPSGAPLQGQAVLFFGSRASTAGADVATFRAEFAQFGAVLTC